MGELRRVDPAAGVAALEHAARFGPYFQLETAVTAADPAADWQSFGWLYRVSGRQRLGELVDEFAGRLRTTERRVAGSVFFQGYAARLWSPILACVAAGQVLPELAAERLHWSYQPGVPLRLRLTAPVGWQLPADDPQQRLSAGIEVLTSQVIDEHLHPMVRALRAVVPVADGLLWGNAASALVGALLMLEHQQPAQPSTRAVVAALLEGPALHGSGTLRLSADGAAFRRRSCCLYYRVPNGGTCGDCPL